MLTESDYESEREREQEQGQEENRTPTTADEYAVHGSPLSDLTAFQIDMLVVIESIGTTHGLGLKTAMSSAYGSLPSGRIYTNLDQLREKGLVTKTEIDGRTNAYELSDLGERELDGFREWIENGITVREPGEDAESTHTADPSERVSQVIDDVMGNSATADGTDGN